MRSSSKITNVNQIANVDLFKKQTEPMYVEVDQDGASQKGLPRLTLQPYG